MAKHQSVNLVEITPRIFQYNTDDMYIFQGIFQYNMSMLLKITIIIIIEIHVTMIRTI